MNCAVTPTGGFLVLSQHSVSPFIAMVTIMKKRKSEKCNTSSLIVTRIDLMTTFSINHRLLKCLLKKFFRRTQVVSAGVHVLPLLVQEVYSTI